LKAVDDLEARATAADGMEVAWEIHHFCRKSLVLMLSVHATAAYIQIALDVGATGYVLKHDVPIGLPGGDPRHCKREPIF
jgi:DNA-binding NarL/FixJ family response regulator